MAQDPCAILATQKGIDPEEAAKLTEMLRKRYKRLNKMGRDMTAEELVASFTAEQRRLAQFRKIGTKKNVIKRRNAYNRIFQPGKTSRETVQNFYNFLVGSNTEGYRNGLSIASKQLAQFDRIFGGMLADMKISKKEFFRSLHPPVFMKNVFTKEATDAAVQREKFAKDLVRELFGENGEGFDLARPVSKSGNEMAFKMAHAITKSKKHLIDRLNSEGAPVGWLANHVTSQYHDPDLIRAMGKEGWIDKISTLLDEERTFGMLDDAERANMLSNIYDNIVSGKRAVHDLTGAGPEAGPFAKMSLANQMSQHRVLHFKSDDAWMQYNKQFGHPDAIDAIFHQLKTLSDETVLIREMGTNPEDSFDRLVSTINSQLAAEGQPALDEDGLKARWMQVTGETYKLAKGDRAPKIYRTVQIFKALQNMSKLGSALLPSFSDVITAVGGLRYNGKGFLSSFHDQIVNSTRAITGNLTEAERDEVLRMVGAGLDGYLGSMHARHDAADATPGTLGRMQDFFFRLSGLSGWTDGQREGFALALSHQFGLNKAKSWDKLHPDFKRAIGQYGIDQAGWEALAEINPKMVEGREYFTPDLIRDYIDANKSSGEFPTRYYEELEEKLSAYYANEIRTGVVEAGAAERSYTMGASKPGTVGWAARALFFQFRTFPVAYLTKIAPRYKQMGFSYTASQMLALTTVGYASMSIRDMLQFREPRDPLDHKTLAAAFLYSGAGGLAGDFVLNDYRQYGRGVAPFLGGPTASTAQDVFTVVSAVANGDLRDASARAFNATARMTPFVNLWWSRTALDFMLINPAKNFLNPGYLQRMEQRQAREQGINYFSGFSPSELAR